MDTAYSSGPRDLRMRLLRFLLRLEVYEGVGCPRLCVQDYAVGVLSYVSQLRFPKLRSVGVLSYVFARRARLFFI